MLVDFVKKSILFFFLFINIFINIFIIILHNLYERCVFMSLKSSFLIFFIVLLFSSIGFATAPSISYVSQTPSANAVLDYNYLDLNIELNDLDLNKIILSINDKNYIFLATQGSSGLYNINDKGLVLSLPLNKTSDSNQEIIVDYSGNDINGVLNNGSGNVEFTDGVIGKCLYLKGTSNYGDLNLDDYILFGNESKLDITNYFTYSFWIKTTDKDGIIFNGYTDGTSYYKNGISTNSDGNIFLINIHLQVML